MLSPTSAPDECLDGSEGKVHNGYFVRRVNTHNYIEGDGSSDLSEDGSGKDVVGEHTRTGKLGQGVVAVETVNTGDGYTTLEFTAGDRIGLMHKINSILYSWQLSVVKAAATTDMETGMAFEKYKVIESATKKALPQANHAALQDILIVALNTHTGGTIRGGSMFRDRSELAADVRDLSLSNLPGKSYTELRMTCASREGLLKDLTLELLKWSLSVQTFELHSDLSSSKYLIHLTTSEGKQLDRLQIKMVQRRLQGHDLASRPVSSDGTEGSLGFPVVALEEHPAMQRLRENHAAAVKHRGIAVLRPAKWLLGGAGRCLQAGRWAAFIAGAAAGTFASRALTRA